MSRGAIVVQRMWRGHVGRRRTAVLRKEITMFILHLREQEAALDEKEYWKNHPVEKWKKNVRTLLRS